MTDPWAAAGAAIDAAFVDPEPLLCFGGGAEIDPIYAIRSDVAASDFAGPGGTLRKVTYEVQQSDCPEQPRKRSTFVHRGHSWIIEDVTRRDDIGKWELVVTDGGPA